MPAVKPEALRVTCLALSLSASRSPSSNNGPSVLNGDRKENFFLLVVLAGEVTKNRSHLPCMDADLSSCLLETSGQGSEERLQPYKKYSSPPPGSFSFHLLGERAR